MLGGGFDIFFGDPSARAGTLDAAQIDAVFFGEAPGDGGDPLALTVLLHGGAANHVEGRLCRGPDFGSVVRPAVRILFTAGIGGNLGGNLHGSIRLRHMGRRRGRLWLWRYHGGRRLALRRRLRGRRCRGAIADLGDDGADRRAFALGDNDLAQLS